MAVTSWSIQREDMQLLRALHGVSHEVGFYIDVGANAPDEHSDTKVFYDHGWHGINIEPSPHWYKRLVEERPRDINIHAAASDKPGSVLLFDHPNGGLGTLNETFADRHETEHNIPKVGVSVESVTLTSVCDQHAPKDIHFLKIDVEGHEAEVIRGMDFRKYRPWILCIEAVEPLKVHIPTHQAWDSMLVQGGYGFVRFDGLNRWYVAAERTELCQAFTYPIDDYIHWTYQRHMDHLERRVRELEAQLAH